jgi:NAD(P)-dependent dehydrogenase (short-subunit alcohol dehydrogenase family)
MGLTEEIAEAVCYFAGDASSYTTGQILTVSGGFGLATPVYGDFVNKDSKR